MGLGHARARERERTEREDAGMDGSCRLKERNVRGHAYDEDINVVVVFTPREGAG